MKPVAVTASRPRCPCCGEPMSAIYVPQNMPPFVLTLVGCETCGITTNELTGNEAVAASCERDYRATQSTK